MDFGNLWQLFLDWLVANVGELIQAVFILIATWIVYRIVRRIFHRLDQRTAADKDKARSARLRTIYQASGNILRIMVLLAGGFGLLALAGVDLSPLLASLGVVGLAISLGAQSLIKDAIAGFLILVENQYMVGEEVAIGEVKGVVEKMTLRATWVREFSGRLHTVPNSEVRTVANASRGWMRAIVDLYFPYTTDLPAVVELLQKVCEEAVGDEKLSKLYIEPPGVVGWNAFTNWAVQVRLVAKTKPGRQYDVELALRQASQQALENAGIPTATPPTY